MKKYKVNQDIRERAASSGIFLWEAASRIGVADTTFSRWLRKPVSDELKQKILQAIDDIANERGGQDQYASR